MNDSKYWLWLSMIFGTGSRRIWEAMRLFDCAEDAYEELSSGAMNSRLDEQEVRNIKNTDIDKTVQFMEYCEKLGISITGYGDDEYPPQLRHILNPPAVLYYKGNISCLKGTRTVTSVGARHASSYGIMAAEQICRELAKSGVVIVSGFAVGIDITSHLAAANIHRPTACVLGCGLDIDYPKENFQYRDIILSNMGVFVTEFPPGTPPHSANFPKRNRILAALGRVTIVFEATQKSGSLITAGMALEQGREVFCLPPSNIFSGSCSGNILFLKDGATPLYSSSDVLDCFKIGSANDSEIRAEFNVDFSDFGVQELEQRKTSPKNKDKIHKRKKKTDRNEKSISVNDNNIQQENPEITQEQSELYADLTPVQKSIAELLSGCRLHADVISQKLEIDSADLMPELTELEILGIIKSLPGKMFESENIN